MKSRGLFVVLLEVLAACQGGPAGEGMIDGSKDLGADTSGAEQYLHRRHGGSGGTGGTTCRPVAGGWSAWNAWTSQAGTCDASNCEQSVVQTRTRRCTNPAPSCGGAACVGSATETATSVAPCSATTCGTCGAGPTALCQNGMCVQDTTCGASVSVNDRFGVEKAYPTMAGGREWTLPDNANQTDSTGEWHPELGSVTSLGNGVFHVTGSQGANQAETRLEVRSPSGKAWWRNVEATWYVRSTGASGSACTSDWWERHWEIEARTERHADNNTTKSQINAGVLAPPGTVTWPWYAGMSSSATVHEPCLGTAYHGNMYTQNGRALFEKEISHVAGYASSGGPNRGSAIPASWVAGSTQWFGYKLIVRNSLSNAKRVHLELWVDATADGNWVKRTQYDDVPGWAATSINGCDAAPYNYTLDQLITWAGPNVTFRGDCQNFDFKWASVREIDPLP
jgi:hypothetical protein